jgi:hypothetical protein
MNEKEIMMPFETGDYVVFTEEKIEKTLEGIPKNLLPSLFDYQNKIIDEMRNNVYVVTECKCKEMFVASLNGKICFGLYLNDFRLATLKEKTKYDLKTIYNK